MVEQQTPQVRKKVRAKLALYNEQPTVELDNLGYATEQGLGWRPDV